MLEITGVSRYGESYEVAHTSMWNIVRLDRVAKPLSEYTEPLEVDASRLVKENVRLLVENEELKGLNRAVCDTCKSDEFIKETWEQAKAAGQQEAWKLAQKIFGSGENIGYKIHQLNEIFDEDWDFTKIAGMSYQEAAAKVEAYERQNEICVGDVVTFYGKCGLVTFIDQQIRGISESGVAFVACKEDCTKTGRHIDVDAWLAQIGGDE